MTSTIRFKGTVCKLDPNQICNKIEGKNAKRTNRTNVTHVQDTPRCNQAFSKPLSGAENPSGGVRVRLCAQFHVTGPLLTDPFSPKPKFCHPPFPSSSFPCRFGFPCLFSFQGIPCDFERFSLLSQRFSGFGKQKKSLPFWWFSFLFSEKVRTRRSG